MARRLTKSQKKTIKMMVEYALEGRRHVRVEGIANEDGCITTASMRALERLGTTMSVNGWYRGVRLTKAGLEQARQVLLAGDETDQGLAASIAAGAAYTKRLRVRWCVRYNEVGGYDASPTRGGPVHRIPIATDADEQAVRRAVTEFFVKRGWDHYASRVFCCTMNMLQWSAALRTCWERHNGM